MQITTSDVLKYCLTLPSVEREILAHRLWESLPEPEQKQQELSEILSEISRRNAEMDAGSNIGRSHGEVIAAARQAIQCK
jgi:putative addiction module component (TIGR02574 family)